MNKYNIINNIVSKYKLEDEINEEIKTFLISDLSSEDIFNIKIQQSQIVKKAFIKGSLEKDFPSFFLLKMINISERGDVIDCYQKDFVNNLKVNEEQAKEIIQEIKKEVLYSDTLYKALLSV